MAGISVEGGEHINQGLGSGKWGRRHLGQGESWCQSSMQALRGLWMPRPGRGPSCTPGSSTAALSLFSLFFVVTMHVPGEAPDCGKRITRVFHDWWCVRSVLSNLSRHCLTIYCLYEGNWVREWPLRILGVRCIGVPVHRVCRYLKALSIWPPLKPNGLC